MILQKVGFKMNAMQNEAFERYMSYHNSRESYE